MNIQQYITSGIIEGYVLGLASPDEVDQLERLLPFYPELQAAISDFGFQVELFAIQNEAPPPPGVFGKIEDRVRETPAVWRSTRSNDGRGRDKGGAADEYIHARVTDDHIYVHKIWRTWFIVFCIMSKVLLALFIYYFVQYQHLQKDVRVLQQQLKINKASLSPDPQDYDK